MSITLIDAPPELMTKAMPPARVRAGATTADNAKTIARAWKNPTERRRIVKYSPACWRRSLRHPRASRQGPLLPGLAVPREYGGDKCKQHTGGRGDQHVVGQRVK